MLQSNFISKAPCPSCRSNGEDKTGDNLAVYDDGHGYCFKCGHIERDGGATPPPIENLGRSQKTRGLEMSGTSGPIKDRNISQRIVEKFWVTLEDDKHHYPYHDKDTGNLVGTKVRNVASKDV
jgi:twinkle protein